MNAIPTIATMNQTELLRKYDIPAPRYTSYPTVPYWTNNPTTDDWIESLNRTLAQPSASLSIYLHLPFCETLCTFCGCNTAITKNHKLVESPYLDTLEKEWQLYKEKVPALRSTPIKELHLGGGSPTYFSEENLERLAKFILDGQTITPDAEFSIEVDPRRTRKTQLEVLNKYGFRRISLGVQDFDPEVQRIVNRIQPEEQTEFVTRTARELGYDSVNFDLIYGLPKQTMESVEYTIKKTLEYRPNRIAFYSYAHVPWIKSSQRLFTEDDLPKAEEKRELYEMGRRLLEEGGYKEIGMDHFALEDDGLWKSFQSGILHRNFMGYTSQKTDVLLGMGTSAISETPDCFHQNEKLEIKYRKILNENNLPTLRGHKLTESDIYRRKLVLEFMTTWKVQVPGDLLIDAKDYLMDMEKDGLIEWENDILKVTESGRPFLRIACTVFDEKLRSGKPNGRLFSQAI